MIIRPLNRVKADAAVPDGGSDAAVITAKRGEPVQLELSCTTGANGYQIVSVTGELDIATAEQAYSYISEVIDGRPAPRDTRGRRAASSCWPRPARRC